LIALDTNVLVRFLAQDDADQARIAGAVIDQLTASAPGFVSREVMIELVWVLERAYGYTRSEIRTALEGLLSATELLIEIADDVGPALDLYSKEGFGFADLMIAAGGYLIARFVLGPDVYQEYWHMMQMALSAKSSNYITGMIQGGLFGVLIGSIACFEGLRVRGGAEGVGKATTMTVVYSIVAIVVAACLCTVVFYVFDF
jgi:predicted nucleic-acid-binding protein